MRRSTLAWAVLVAGLVWPSAAAAGPFDALDPRDDYAPIESDVLLADDFDDGTIDATNWSTWNVEESDDCGSVSPPRAMKFEGPGDRARVATTRALNVSRPGLVPVNVTVDFELKHGSSLESTDPDVVEELCDGHGGNVDLKLLWRDLGGEWEVLETYDAWTYAGSFRHVRETIHLTFRAAWREVTDRSGDRTIRLRWFQPDPMQACPCDHWAIDDVEIRLRSVQGAFPTVEKDHLFGRTVCLDEDGDERCEDEEHDLSPAVDCSNSSRVVGDPDCGSYSAYDDEDRDHRRDDDEWTIATTPGARLGPASDCSHWPNVRVYRDRNASGHQDPGEPTLVRACGEEGWPTLSVLGHPLLTVPPEWPGG